MTRKILNIEVKDVEKRRYPGKHYVYVIHVYWSDGSNIVIYRRYSRFFDLQSKLLDKFPLESGAVEPSKRVIPLLPGKILFGRSHIRDVALKRLKPIDDYCKGLIKTCDKISQCDEVIDFFSPEQEDLSPPTDDKKPKKESKAEKISKPRKQKQYKVIADYDKQETGEITLQEGTIVEVVEKSETGWWFVNGEDEQGWVPSTYLEPLDGEAENGTTRLAPGEEEQYICIASFSASNPDEISLEKGVVVEVVEKNLDGWWLVRYQGQEGLAPATYLDQTRTNFNLSLAEKGRASGVEIVGTLSDVSDLLNKESKKEEKDEEKNEETGLRYSVGPQGDAYAKINVKSRSLERGGSLRPPPRQNSIVVSKEQSLSPKPSSKSLSYITVADFTDPVGDGISFTAGERVTVIEKGANDWWFVQINGREGWAPMSYIQSSESSSGPKQITETVVEEEEDSSDSDSSSHPAAATAAATASGIAAALKGKFNKQNTTESESKPGLPSTQNRKPLGVKLSLPKPVAKPENLSSTERHSTASHRKTQPSSDDNDDDDGNDDVRSRTGVSDLASMLKSKFETRQNQGVSVSKPNLTDNSNRKGSQPGKAMMPKGVNVSVKKEDEEEGVIVKSVFPVRPASDTEAKPWQKEPADTNRPASMKPTLPGRPKPVVASGKKPSAAPPAVPSNPPGLLKKPLTQDADSNNNDKQKFPSGVSGITAALKSKFENKPECEKSKPSVPAASAKPNLPSSAGKPNLPSSVGKPNLPSSVGKPNLPPAFCKPNLPLATSKPTLPSSVGKPNLPSAHGKPNLPSATAKPNLPASGSKPGKINTNWNSQAGNSSRPASSQSAADELKSIKRGGKPVGDLVSALSGKLNFGGEQPAKRLSAEPSSDHRPSVEVNNALNKNKSETYTAVADYSSQGEGELSMEEGEEFTVIDKTDSGWWQVSRLGGEEGWVPSSYLQVKESKASLKHVNSDRSSNPTPKPAPNKSQQSETKVQYRTTAMFTAENAGEVGFDEGEVVEVIEKTEEGWWFVQIGGTEGWAPADYIREEVINVPVQGGAKPPAPPKNKPAFKPSLPAYPR